jgi:hypothetical protein
MKDFLSACINKTNTKYFTYLRFLIIGIFLIPVLFISLKPASITEAQGGLEGQIGANVNPIHASTNITVSGTVWGSGTDTGDKCSTIECPPLNIVQVSPVIGLEYSIDNGAWVNISSSLVQTAGGEDTNCGWCTDYVPFQYSFTRLIDISALPQGNHTINIRAESSDSTSWETGPMVFDNIPFDFQVQPNIDSGWVYQSGTHSVGIIVGRLSGQAGLVNLSVSPASIPPNTTITFSPISCTPSDECASVMTIQTQATTPPTPDFPETPYQIIVIGTHTLTDPDIIHTGNYFLTVEPMPPIMISVAADPPVGTAPLSNIEVTVDVGGTATGLMDIQIDCGEDGTGDLEHIASATSTNPYIFTGCNYPLLIEDSYMILASVSRGTNSSSATTMVTANLAPLSFCAHRASGGGAQLIAGISESWPTNSIHVFEAAGRGSSLRGGFYTMDFSCTACIAEDNTDYRTGAITAFEYRFDNTGLWMPLDKFPNGLRQWGDESVTGLEGCYVWTGCCLGEDDMYNMYWFDFNLDISALSVGGHILNLRARELWTHAGGFNEVGGWFDAYDFSSTIYDSIPFAKNGSPGIELIGPADGSYINASASDPTFSAQVTDPNIGQPLFAHFRVVGFGENDGSITTTPSTSSWGPVAGLNDGTYFWRAYAQDDAGATSSWSGYWSFTKDTILPIASISYPVNDTYDPMKEQAYLRETYRYVQD